MRITTIALAALVAVALTTGMRQKTQSARDGASAALEADCPGNVSFWPPEVVRACLLAIANRLQLEAAVAEAT